MEILFPAGSELQPNIFREIRINRRIQFPEYLIYKRR